MPGAMLPDDPSTPGGRDWYARTRRLPPVEQEPLGGIEIGRKTVHFLATTPPVFDGPEDRNGTELR